MCGILGWSGPGHAPFDRDHFVRALDLLAHRGPDDQGVWTGPGAILGHRRLSIIDLSDKGHQPMVSASGASVIVYNGEVYNYAEIKSQLLSSGRHVSGGSDTGVLLEAVEFWGPAVLPQLNGMWAFASWDHHARRLFLCRDRFGVKPLYYCLDHSGLAFASEPKALLELFPARRRMSPEVMLNFLAHSELYERNESFYEGIHLLPPGHFANYEADSNTLTIARYWDYPAAEDLTFTPQRAIDEFSALFDDAVRVRFRSDVPVGLTLSGGLDSSAVLAAAVSTGMPSPRCFTSTYDSPGADEFGWAAKAAAVAGAELTSVRANDAEWINTLEKISWHMDGPGYSPAVYPLWCLMQEARRSRVPVLLEGQGADEELAGYPQYAVRDLIDYVAGGRFSPGEIAVRVRGMIDCYSARWTLAWLVRELSPALLARHRRRNGFQSLLRPGAIGLQKYLRRERMPGSVRDRLLADHSTRILPGLLHYGDAVSMAHSVESRQPFLDYRLVEWLFRLPTEFKLRHGQSKWVLREYLRSGHMAEIGNRKDKLGYPTPIGKWLASDGGRSIESVLTRKSSIFDEWLDPEKVRTLFARGRSGALAADHHLYKLVSAQLWFSQCIERGAAH